MSAEYFPFDSRQVPAYPVTDYDDPSRFDEPMVPEALERAVGGVIGGASTATGESDETCEWDEPLPPMAPAPSNYSYGVDSTLVRGSGSLSPTEILVWLQAHSNDLNAQLHDRMYEADVRNKLVEDLTFLVAQIKGRVPSDDKIAQANELLDAYQGTPFAEEAEAVRCLIAFDGKMFSHADADTLKTKIQSAIDKLGKDDQLDMVFIQDLVNRLSQIFGVGSNLVSSFHETTKAIIGNLGR